MPKFNSFPINYPITNHVDERGSMVDDGASHAFSQGWIQSFAQASSILQGNWTKDKLSVNGVGTVNASLTPWAFSVFMQFSSDQGAQNISLLGGFCGALDLIRGATLIQKIVVNGQSISIPSVLNGDVVCGSLTPIN